MMDRLRTGSLQWAVGAFLALMGAIMLVAPHQLAFLNYTWAAMKPFEWGLVFLFAGVGLFGSAVVPNIHQFSKLLHLLAGVLLGGLAFAFILTGSWIVPLNLAILGLGAVISGFNRGWSGRPGEERTKAPDLLALSLATAASLSGVIMLLSNLEGTSNPVYSLSGAQTLIFGVAFTLAGVWLALVQIATPYLKRTWVRIWAHLAVGAVMLAFLLLAALPTRMWTPTAFYGWFGLFVALLPWLNPALDSFPLTLRGRLALVLATTVSIPMILGVAVAGGLEERMLRVEVLALQESLARDLAQELDEHNLLHEGEPALSDDQIFVFLQDRGVRTGGRRLYLVDPQGRLLVDSHTPGGEYPAAWQAIPILGSLPAGDPDGSLTYWGDEGEVMAGYARSQTTGRLIVIENPVDELFAGMYIGRDVMFGVLLVFLALGAVGGTLLAGWMVSPLETLTQAVSGLGEGEKTIPLPRTEFQEVQRLTAAFAEMRQRLAARTAEREQALSELRSANEELAAAKAELERRVIERTAELAEANASIGRVNEELSQLNMNLERELDAREKAEIEREKYLHEAERRAAEAEEGRSILEALLEHIPQGITIVDAEGTVRRISKYGELMDARLRGAQKYHFEQAFQSWELFAGDGVTPLPLADFALSRALRRGEVVENEEIVLKQNGRSFALLCNAGPIRDEAGRVTGGVLSWWDISERKQMMARLAYQARVLESVHDAVIAVGQDGVITSWNRAAEDLYGWKAEEVLGLLAQEIIPSRLNPDQMKELEYELIHAGGTRLEVIQQNRDGQSIVVESRAVTLTDSRGNPTGYVFANRDITRRVKAEQALRNRERQLRTVLENLPVGVWMANEKGEIIYGNLAGLRIWQGAEYVGPESFGVYKGWWYETGEPIIPEDWAIARAVRSGETSMNELIEIECFDGTHKIINNSAVPVWGEDRKLLGVIVVNEDVTERIRNEQARKEALTALKVSEARARRLIEANVLGVAYRTAAGEITEANDAFLEMVGYSREDLKASRVCWSDLVSLGASGQDSLSLDEARTLGACKPFETEYLRKDGEKVPVLVGVALVTGEPEEFVTFSLNLKEQKQAEQEIRSYAQQLERSNRDLQDFAFIASHDLQEPLRKIQAFGDLLMQEIGAQENSQAEDFVNRMRDAAARMKRMIDDLLSYSRVSTRENPLELVDLSQLASEVLSDQEVRIAMSGGTVEVGELPSIEADPSQIRQVFQNLIGNSLKFHRPDVPPHVRVWAEQVPARDPDRYTADVRIVVEDNGIGFDEQYLDRLFQPFQRLHGRSQYEGSGIGLAICRRIVERHGGIIEAHSAPGQGATFIMTLPARRRMA